MRGPATVDVAERLNFEPVDRNLRESMQCYARGAERGEIREMPGVLVANASSGSAVFNAAMLACPVGAEPAELDRRIMIARSSSRRAGCGGVSGSARTSSILAAEEGQSDLQRRRLSLCSDCRE
jgi:hypothetical protein